MQLLSDPDLRRWRAWGRKPARRHGALVFPPPCPGGGLLGAACLACHPQRPARVWSQRPQTPRTGLRPHSPAPPAHPAASPQPGGLLTAASSLLCTKKCDKSSLSQLRSACSRPGSRGGQGTAVSRRCFPCHLCSRGLGKAGLCPGVRQRADASLCSPRPRGWGRWGMVTLAEVPGKCPPWPSDLRLLLDWPRGSYSLPRNPARVKDRRNSKGLSKPTTPTQTQTASSNQVSLPWRKQRGLDRR